MNIENLQRIATLFHVSAEPPAVEVDSSGVWEVSASSAPPFSPFAAGLVLSISALGATPAEALAAYQRTLVLRAALMLPALRNCRAQAHAFVLAADEVDAAIVAELAVA
jgi:hypothetical protein